MKKILKWLNNLARRWEGFSCGCEFPQKVLAQAAGQRIFSQKKKPHCLGVDNRQFLKRYRFQGRAPSCVSFGIGHAIQMVEGFLRSIGKLKRKSIPSESWIFYLSRAAHNAIVAPLTGTYIHLALGEIETRGCPPAKAWTYKPKASWLNKRPTGEMERQAVSRSGFRFAWIVDDPVMDTISALEQQDCGVVFGTQITDSFRNYKPGQVLRRPVKEIEHGGHCMAIGAYRRAGNRFEFCLVNSWRGLTDVWVDQDYLTWNRTHDIAAIYFEEAS